MRTLHCVKSARNRSFSGPHFPAFGLNTESQILHSVQMRENVDQKNSEYRHVSPSVFGNTKEIFSFQLETSNVRSGLQIWKNTFQFWKKLIFLFGLKHNIYWNTCFLKPTFSYIRLESLNSVLIWENLGKKTVFCLHLYSDSFNVSC